VGGATGVLVVVDVLSFTTAVAVAVERGAAVYPVASRGVDAMRLAREVGGVLAVDRCEVTEANPWSLSPAALRSAPSGLRLVLPSPNGSAIAAAAGSGVVVAASLGNARAVGDWLSDRPRSDVGPVSVIAAGERWPDGSLRPALEDLLGAGAVLAALAARAGLSESPEAVAARALYESRTSVADDVRRSVSGRELAAAGFGDDVEVAVEVDTIRAVPVVRNGSFQRA
jgi:2-phosphosulfolactate phosphatase